MRKILSLFVVLLFTITSKAQIHDPVKWKTSIEKISDSEYFLVATAKLEKGWHLYSQKVPEFGPIPTTFYFKSENNHFEVVGTPTEPKGHKVFDKQFNMEVVYFEKEVVFKQKIKLLTDEEITIKAEVEYMVCDDSRCLPPTFKDLVFKVKGKKATTDKIEAQTNIFQSETKEEKKSEILDPVKWSTSVEKINDSDFYLVSTAKIDKGWHLYSQNIPVGGPIPTNFLLKDSLNTFQLIGKPIEPKGHAVLDKQFEMELVYFENEAVFKQKIRLLTDAKVDIKTEVEYMACDDGRCTPPTYKELTFSLQGKAGEKLENASEIIVKEDQDKNEKKGKSAVKKKKQKDLWTIFILSFLAGFAALLTPCVFPMIPMTVSFFTKQSKTKAEGIKKAIFYGIAIIVIYMVLGLVVTWIFDAKFLNELSTNEWFNLIFFIILIVFAASFLGAFEIMLPQSWANKMDSKADRGGIIGIIFMALALAIVSFSCTGPIVGTLLVESASKGGIAPAVGMFGFSLALALPFSLFAAFPGWMNSLPKSGGWLNTVKVVLGFLELALAFKFLSNADIVLQLHFLEREVFIAIWIAIFGALTLYLFGKIQLPHDSPLHHISVGRLMLGLLTLSFTVYITPGLWGAPVKLVSAFLPPMKYSESPYGVGFMKKQIGGTASFQALPEGAKYGPHDIPSFTDYDKGVTYAKKVNKPILIDFTGHACVNCRKMEANVWSDEQILKILNNEIVLISLYVDERKSANGEISKITGEPYRYIGQKWSEMQVEKYKTNAQPYYVLVDLEEEKLNEPSAYNPDIDEYKDWLREGIDNFNKNKKH
ncbi:protein-disulfide reductase DsbD domain-containing protein [Aureivirga marina]|uniref:protein-disulfide reductase DsbD domain-containing protein n=1 Tax=Aureivirga marina TaxID=1182451 RepID=UPI0018CBF1A8|nr:protein-disulfide reductase DsbD domain-containing protein [Aureivirga marina]